MDYEGSVVGWGVTAIVEAPATTVTLNGKLILEYVGNICSEISQPFLHAYRHDCFTLFAVLMTTS